MKPAPYRLTVVAAAMSAAMAPVVVAGPGTVTDATGTYQTYFANSPLLTKFIDSLPGLTPAGINNLKQYLPVAAMDTASYPGSDYMEMAVVDYREHMHSELPAGGTLLRGYVQIDRSATDAGTPGTASTSPLALRYPDGNPIWIAKEVGMVNGRWDHTLAKDANGQTILVHAVAVDKPHYLGPIILAAKDRATRVKFDNLLKAGAAVTTTVNGKTTLTGPRNGDLFIPTDHTLAGTDFVPAPGGGYSTTLFRENRAELHLHGGSTPWISDGTPHQYIMPAQDELLFKKNVANGGLGLPDYARGSSTVNVPDMPDPGPGSTTYYWTNADSGRLMMYHDHTSGTTRLNAYVGEAAGYLIHDAAENGLMQQVLGTNDYIAAEGIPLAIQDKSFVPADIVTQDALWDQNAWGKPGDLWFPHVYEPATFADGTANPAGRWDLGVSTWPPVNLPTGLKLPGGGYGDATHVPEAFMDTALVNGTAYPYLTVEPKAYRFRVLSVGNDRAFNLGLYVAADKNTVDVAQTDPYANAALCDANSPPSNCTEVKMVPFDATQRTFPAYWGTPDIYPDGNGGVVDNTPMGLHLGGVPDPATAGPVIYQIGTEGGLFDHVVEIPSTVTNYENMTDINNPANPNLPLLVVKEHGLHLAPAERADVVIDFSQYAGKTLILYNDAPAPSPGPDSRYDYFTGDADQTSMGGAPTTLPGKGPNTRTVMQIRVAPAAPGTTPAPFAVYDAAGTLDPASGLGKLKAGLPGVVAATQDPLLAQPLTVNDIRFNDKYNGGTEVTITAPGTTAVQRFTAKEKTIFEDFDFLGRITANLGTWLPGNNAAAGSPLPQAYINPNTDTVADGQVEIWRVTHNGVDMHPIHFHLVNLQVLARIGWDGVVRQPEPTEVGWKETIQMVPMTDILVAVKAKTPKIPFGVPNSVRPLDPSQPLGSSLFFTQVDPITGQPANFTNQIAEFNWEYVWHCHILGHEENDLMRPLTLNFAATVPANAPVLSAPATVGSLGASVNLTWTDPTPVTGPVATTDPASEIGFRLEKAPVVNGVVGAYGAVGTITEYKKGVVNGVATKLAVNALANATGSNDTIVATGDWSYRVYSVNAAGDSSPSNPVTVIGVPAAPTAPAIAGNAVGADTIGLTWIDAATNETGYLVEYSADMGVNWSIGATLTTPNATSAVVTGLTPNTLYQFRISAVNSGVTGSAGTNSAVISAPTLPAVTGLTTSYAAVTRKATLNWADAATLETGYVVQRQIGAVNATTGAVTWGVATNAALPANTTTWTSPALTANTLYKFSVYPINGTLTGPVSSVIMASTATANLIPSAPTQMQVTQVALPAGARQLKVQWQQSISAGITTGYQVQRCQGTVVACGAAGAIWVAAVPDIVNGSNNTLLTDTGLATKTPYTYRVRAINSQIPTLVSNWGPLKAGTTR